MNDSSNNCSVSCCVFGCKNSVGIYDEGVTLHRFPQIGSRCSEWLKLILRPDLQMMLEKKGSEYIYRKFRVCSDHFTEDCFKSNKRVGLWPHANPTLFSHCFPDTADETSSVQPNQPHNRAKQLQRLSSFRKNDAQDIVNVTSCSRDESTGNEDSRNSFRPFSDCLSTSNDLGIKITNVISIADHISKKSHVNDYVCQGSSKDNQPSITNVSTSTPRRFRPPLSKLIKLQPSGRVIRKVLNRKAKKMGVNFSKVPFVIMEDIMDAMKTSGNTSSSLPLPPKSPSLPNSISSENISVCDNLQENTVSEDNIQDSTVSEDEIKVSDDVIPVLSTAVPSVSNKVLKFQPPSSSSLRPISRPFLPRIIPRRKVLPVKTTLVSKKISDNSTQTIPLSKNVPGNHNLEPTPHINATRVVPTGVFNKSTFLSSLSQGLPRSNVPSSNKMLSFKPYPIIKLSGIPSLLIPASQHPSSATVNKIYQKSEDHVNISVPSVIPKVNQLAVSEKNKPLSKLKSNPLTNSEKPNTLTDTVVIDIETYNDNDKTVSSDGGFNCNNNNSFIVVNTSKEDKPTNNSSAPERFCRICGLESKDLDLIYLYCKTALEKKLPDLINKFLPIKVNNDESVMPKRICFTCWSSLLDFEGFVKKCQLADVWLHKKFDVNVRKDKQDEVQFTGILLTPCEPQNPQSCIKTKSFDIRKLGHDYCSENSDQFKNNVEEVDVIMDFEENDADNESNLEPCSVDEHLNECSSSSEISKNTLNKTAKNTSSSSPKNTSSTIAKNTSDSFTENTSNKTSKNTKNTSDSFTENASNKTSKNTSSLFPMNTSNETAKNTSSLLPMNTSNENAKNTSDSFAKNTSNETAKNTSSLLSMNTSNETAKDTSSLLPMNTSNENAKNTSDSFSENTSNEINNINIFRSGCNDLCNSFDFPFNNLEEYNEKRKKFVEYIMKAKDGNFEWPNKRKIVKATQNGQTVLNSSLGDSENNMDKTKLINSNVSFSSCRESTDDQSVEVVVETNKETQESVICDSFDGVCERNDALTLSSEVTSLDCSPAPVVSSTPLSPNKLSLTASSQALSNIEDIKKSTSEPAKSKPNDADHSSENDKQDDSITIKLGIQNTLKTYKAFGLSICNNINELPSNMRNHIMCSDNNNDDAVNELVNTILSLKEVDADVFIVKKLYRVEVNLTKYLENSLQTEDKIYHEKPPCSLDNFNCLTLKISKGSANDFKQLLKESENENQNRYFCGHCLSTCKNADEFCNHMVSLHPEELLQCPICKLVFNEVNNFSIHLQASDCVSVNDPYKFVPLLNVTNDSDEEELFSLVILNHDNNDGKDNNRNDCLDDILKLKTDLEGNDDNNCSKKITATYSFEMKVETWKPLIKFVQFESGVIFLENLASELNSNVLCMITTEIKRLLKVEQVISLFDSKALKVMLKTKVKKYLKDCQETGKIIMINSVIATNYDDGRIKFTSNIKDSSFKNKFVKGLRNDKSISTNRTVAKILEKSRRFRDRKFLFYKYSICELCGKKVLYHKRADHKKMFHTERKCGYCERTFNVFKELQKHEQTHRSRESLYCKTCMVMTKSSIAMMNHKFSVHDIGVKCDVCSRVFEDDYALTTHKKNHTPKTELCPHCGDLFRPTALAKHIQIHHTKKEEVKVLCTHCGKIFANRQKLTHHKSQFHRQRQCFYCDRVFGVLRELRLHEHEHRKQRLLFCEKCNVTLSTHLKMKIHNIEVHNMGHQCQICDRKFYKKNSLATHIKYVHASQEEKLCPQCGGFFKSSIILNKHIKTVHTSQEEEFKCQFCNKLYKSQKAMKIHTARFHREKPMDSSNVSVEESGSKQARSHKKLCLDTKPVTCLICGFQFERIKQHLQFIHWTKFNKPAEEHYLCLVCKITLEDSESLIQHMKFHSHENRVKEARGEDKGKMKCVKCNRFVNSKLDLAIHNFFHHDSAPFPCTRNGGACESTFWSKAAFDAHVIKVHNKIHTTLTCGLCNIKFSTRTESSAHRKKIHPTIKQDKSAACNICQRVFRSSYTLKIHMAAAHSDVKNNVCTRCGKRFTFAMQLAKHHKWHDQKDKRREDESAIKAIENDMTDSSVEYDSMEVDVHETSAAPNEKSDTVIIDSTNTLYKCQPCNIMFIDKRTADNHFREKHKTVKVSYAPDYNYGLNLSWVPDDRAESNYTHF